MSIIMQIIAIALTGLILAAGAFYGGSAYTNRAIDAQASIYITQAQQVQSAASTFIVDEGGTPTSISVLNPDYLSVIPNTPAGPAWELDQSGRFVYVDLEIGTSNGAGTITQEVCEKVNEKGSGMVFCGTGADEDAARAASLTGTIDPGESTAAITMKF